MGYGGGSGAGMARKQEEERQRKLDQGRAAIDERFAGFTDDFYDQREADYIRYAQPQLEMQAKTSRNQLAAALARRGLLKSGAAMQSNADFDLRESQARQEVADAAVNEGNKLRSAVEDQRSNAVNQLVASGDPSVASAQALTSAETLKRPTGFGALGNFFSDWVDTYRANQEARSYDDRVQPMFSFGKPRSSVSYVN